MQMKISNNAKKYIENHFSKTNTSAISIVISHGCCGGGTIHMAFIKKDERFNYQIINDIPIQIEKNDLDDLSDLLIDYTNKIILKEIKSGN
jgi:Fe-S cluster assembly iron-binding protein IscA